MVKGWRRHGLKLAGTAGVALALTATPAAAVGPGLIVEAPPEVAETRPAYSDRVNFAWGVALTSNYISSGETQSDDKPALQGYFEISSGLVYASVWFSTVELEPDHAEFDLTWGLRPVFGALSFDIGYTRYVYNDTGDCCGEWIGKVEYETGQLTLSGVFSWDPQSNDRSVTTGFAWEFAKSFSLSGEIEEDISTRATSWNAGLTWQATDTLSLELSYQGSENFPGRYVATLAYDFSTAD